MSHRFPPLASQYDLTTARRNRTPVAVLTLAQIPSLPWFEMLIGAAFLMALRLI
jgi:hypothetical protein